MTDLARVALAAVVEHWPGDLDGVWMTAVEDDGDPRGVRASVVLRQDGYVMQIGFTGKQLERRDPGMKAQVELAHPRLGHTDRRGPRLADRVAGASGRPAVHR